MTSDWPVLASGEGQVAQWRRRCGDGGGVGDEDGGGTGGSGGRHGPAFAWLAFFRGMATALQVSRHTGAPRSASWTGFTVMQKPLPSHIHRVALRVIDGF